MALQTLNQASGAVSTKGHSVAEFLHMRDDVMREKKLEHLSTAHESRLLVLEVDVSDRTRFNA